MRMEVINAEFGRQELLISHLNDSSIWKLAEFDKAKFSSQTDLFYYNNKYLERFSPAEQNRLFAIYKEIRHIFDTGVSGNVLHNRLVPLIKELLDSHDLIRVESWIRLHTDIQYPNDLKTEYTDSLFSNKTREQTYLKDDYIKLICLIFVLRLMVPIWSEFITRTKKETGNHFKEYTALQLISEANIVQSESMSKLITYVRLAIPEDSLKSGLLVFLSSEDFPIWMLSVIVIKMLCITDIKGIVIEDETGLKTVQNIVPFIYNNVKEKIKRAEVAFGQIKDKNPESSSSDNESSSNVETYKIKQEIPSGDVVMLEYAMSNIGSIVLKLEPNIDVNLLYNALETSESLYKARIYEPQITLLQWIYKPVIPPKAIPLLTKRTVVNALAGAQAILWHRGHYELAGLVTATTVGMDPDTGEHYISGVESRSKVTKESLEELNRLFPYAKKDNSKTKSKPVNQAIAGIDRLAVKLSEYNWLLTIDNREKITVPSMLQLLTGSTVNRRFSIPHNIKNKIALLIIDLAKRPRNIRKRKLKMSDTFVFGGHNKTTNMRVVRLQLQETGTYDPQYIRPLTTELNSITQNAILDTMPGMNGKINPYTFANIAGSFLQRSATPESQVAIPNGWNERRLRFLLEITFEFQTGGMSTHYYMGYTDYTGITNNSNIDPNLRLYINAKIVTRKGTMNTPFGVQPFENIVCSNQVLQNFSEPGFYKKPNTFSMRPSEVYTYMLDSFTNNNLAADSYDFRAVINGSGATVDRKLCTPAHYGAELFNNIFEQRLLAEEGSNTRGRNLTIESIEKAKANYYTDGVDSSRGGPNWNDPFLVALSNVTSNLAGNSFTYGNLMDLDPNTYNVTYYNKLSQAGLAQVNQAGITQHWGGSDISTKAAATISHTIPALMLENMLMKVGFISTNRDIGGGITTRIFDYHGFSNTDLTEYFNRFILAVDKLVINEISINNMLSYYVKVTSDVMGETWIEVSIDNEPTYTYVAPSFSDGIFSPLITNSYQNICAVGTDFMMLYDSMNNENAAMTGSRYNLI